MFNSYQLTLSPCSCPQVHTTRQLELEDRSASHWRKDRGRPIHPPGSNYTKSQYSVVKENWDDLQKNIYHDSYRSWQIFGMPKEEKEGWNYCASEECGLIFEMGLLPRDQQESNCRVRSSSGIMTLRVFLATVFRVAWHRVYYLNRRWGENKREKDKTESKKKKPIMSMLTASFTL